MKRQERSSLQTNRPVQIRRFIVLDRDGTVIKLVDHLTDVAQVQLIPGAALALKKLMQLGFGLVVVTNQSVVGRGLITEIALQRIHRRMEELLNAQGVALDGLYYCPHHPDAGCSCRKPAQGLVLIAADALGFDPAESVFIGDNVSDIELGRSFGATTILVQTGHGLRAEALCQPDFVTQDLAAAAELVAPFVGDDRIP